jgi:hypothetical protein
MATEPYPEPLLTLGGVAAPSHDERLSIPMSWWPAIAVIVAFAIFEIASGFTLVIYIPVIVFVFGFFVVPPFMSGRLRVKLQDGVLSAGSDDLPVTTITTITPLDREATRLRLGPQADPAAKLVVRGWIGSSVMVRLSNPDPVPYWVVSTRHPEDLAAAIKTERTTVRAAKSSR